jgi:branched-chain amino acid transport system permease protein
MKAIDTFLTGLSTGSIYSLMSIALVLVWRSTRVINFAQAGQAVLSTYMGYEVIVRTNSFWLGLIGAMLAGALIGALIDFLFMRTLFKRVNSGPIVLVAPVVATLGLLGIIQAVTGFVWGLENKSITPPVSTGGFQIGERTLPFGPLNLLIVVAVTISLLILALIFQRTNIGLALRASAFSPEISRLSGIKVDLVRTLGWAISGAAGGLAGMLFVSNTALNPNAMDVLLVFGFVSAVIGGLDSLIGAVAGGLVLGMAINFAVAYIDTQMIFPTTFIILILVLLLKPSGLFSKAKGRRD